jgi:lysozyme family protein
VNDPLDRGGETNYGITKAVARKNGYHGDMRDMPASLARKIYTNRYINEPNFHLVIDCSEAIAAELIDTGVNMGPHRASEFLQRWLNGFNLGEYEDLFIDGRVGEITINALSIYLDKRGKEGEQVLLTALNCTQGNRYLELTENRTTNRRFLYGWVRQRVKI